MREFTIGKKAMCVSIFGLEQVLKLHREYIVTAITEHTISILLEDGIECEGLSTYRFIPVKE